MIPGADPTPSKPVERILRALGYLGIGAAAVWILVLPPTSMASDLGKILTAIWCCFLLMALPASVAAFIGRYRGEYACIPWFGGAMVLALLHSWIEAVNGAPDVTPRALSTTALVLFISARFVTLHQLVKVMPKGEPWTRKRSRQ